MRLRNLILPLTAAALLTVLMATPAQAVVHAQAAGQATITGRLSNGTEGAIFDPSTVAVTLNVFEGVSSLTPTTVKPAADGTFSLTITPDPKRVYFLSVEYEGATYSATVDLTKLDTPIDLTVYEATSDPSVLHFTDYSIIVTGVVPAEHWFEVLERATVVNDSGKTLVPDLSAQGPAMLNFLRFATPAGAYHLSDPQTTVVGGQVVTVDKGFALTTPIPPTNGTPDEFEFVYRMPYKGAVADLSRPLPFGADVVRYVVPADVGRPTSPNLEDLGAAELNGGFYRLMEAQNVKPGDVLQIGISELPQPSWWDLTRHYAGEWYVRFLVPGAAVLVLAVFGFIIYRRRKLVPAVDPTESVESARERLHARLAEITTAKEQGKMSERRYEGERDQIRQALIDLRVREQAEHQA